MTFKALIGAIAALCWLTAAAAAAPIFPSPLYVFGYSGYATQPAPMLILNRTVFIRTSGYPDTANTGWWDMTGSLGPLSPNYITGRLADLTFHDYFVFDLSDVPVPITAATLLIYNPGPRDNPGHHNGFVGAARATVSVFDVTTPIPDLETHSMRGSAIFADLGSGVLYGEQTVTAASNGGYVVFDLNADALADLNGRQGPLFAFGTAITGSVPEPASLALFAAALAGLFGVRRRRESACTSLRAV